MIDAIISALVFFVLAIGAGFGATTGAIIAALIWTSFTEWRIDRD